MVITISQPESSDLSIRNHQLIRLTFNHGQVRRLADRGLHRRGIKLTIGLGAGAPDGRTLPAIQDAKLDTARVSDPAHQSIQRIDFPNQVTFAKSTDRRIAGHGADGREMMRDQRGAGAHARRSRGRLAARMAAANDDDVVGCQVIAHGRLSNAQGRCSEDVSRETLRTGVSRETSRPR